VGGKTGRPGTRQAMLLGLRRTWEAWMFGRITQSSFGANSFALIALSLIFDLVDDLKGSQERRGVEQFPGLQTTGMLSLHDPCCSTCT